MTDPLDSPPPTTYSAPAAPLAPGPLQTAHAAGTLAKVALAVALLALTASFWEYNQRKNRLQQIESQAAERIVQLQNDTARLLAENKRMSDDDRAGESRLRAVENKISEKDADRTQVEELLRELARGGDERTLSEVDQHLLLAQQQLALGGNVKGAILALQNADQRLARADRLDSADLRRAIGADITQLQALPVADTLGIAVKLESIAALVDTLPLLDTALTPPPKLAPVETDGSWGQRLWRDFAGEFKLLVRVRELDRPEAALLAPNQAYFLRENLRLKLQAARLALIAREDGLFKSSLQDASTWVAKYFDARAKSVVTTAEVLKTLRAQTDTSRNESAPTNINRSLGAARDLRARRTSK